MSTLAGRPVPPRGGAYDYDGPVLLEYSPHLDRDADPGEVVWAWVAYEDDPTIGKDRPVAVVGRTPEAALVVLMLSSKGHDGDRNWTPIGSGPWDQDGRPSWVRRDRVLSVPASAVRREAAILPREVYDSLIRELGQGGASVARDTGVRGRLRRLFGRGSSSA